MQLSQPWLKFAFSGLLIIGGGGLSVFGFGFVEEAIAAKSWSTIEGYIKTTKLMREARGKRKITTHHLSITYGYIVDQIAYTNDRYSFGKGNIASERFRSKSQAISAQNQYPANSKIRIYYDPNNPSNSVIKPGLDLTTFVPVIFGLLICSSGLRLLFLVLRHSPQ